MKQTTIRIKNELYNKLLALAEKENRSISNAINLLLERALNEK